MEILEYWSSGQIKYWIDIDNPLFGRSLWKRNKNGESHLIKDIPAKFKKYFQTQKEEAK